MIAVRRSISFKLFIAMSVATTLVVIFLTVMTALNMRTGFARYLALAELGRFDSLVLALAQRHDSTQPGWPDFRTTPRAWHAFVRKIVPPPRRTPPRQRDVKFRSNKESSPQRLRPPPDPMRFGQRLVLQNAKGERIVGGSGDFPVFVRTPILALGSNTDAKPLGWLGLIAMPGPVGAGNSLFLKDQLFALLITSLIALGLSALLAFLLARQLLKPIRTIANAGDRLAGGDYSIRLDNNRHDELGALLHQFNTLAENLEARDLAERKWVSDTSHELKTPLAVLRAQIEAIQDGVHEGNEKRLKELHTSTMRLSQLVADLNTLSNAREGQLAITKQIEDIAEIAETTLEQAIQSLPDLGLKMQGNIEPRVLLNCDRLRMGQLLDNLLQNARRYTSSPGTIRLTLSRHSDGIEITVEDTPPCPPQSARDKLFDRFYREELSRDRKYGGSGLGLSICREIVHAHGGTISLSQSTLGGLKVRVLLPEGQSTNE